MYCTKNVNIINLLSLEISLTETKSMKKGFYVYPDQRMFLCFWISCEVS